MTLIPFLSFSNPLHWEVLSPLPDSIAGGQNVFVAVKINDPNSFKAGHAVVFLDNKQVNAQLRMTGTQISFLYPGILTDGRHVIRIEARIEGSEATQIKEWPFYVNTRTAVKSKADKIRLAGSIVADNRSTFLTGTGKDLRQEPDYISSVGIDLVARYKNAELPVRVFMTTNNRFTSQTMNYYQVGFRNKWLELEAGDLNPNMDRLILTGIRLRGVRAVIRTGGNSIQFFTGEMNRASEGSLVSYTSGSGMLPTNPVNDSQYVASGIYKRTMTAVRIEIGNRRQVFKIGLNGFKAKDVISSIRYGLAPKENVAAGMDLGLNLFKRSVSIHSGVAASILTNNTQYGVISQTTLDTTYGIKLGFDPNAFSGIITMNASTVPSSLDNLDFLAWYGTLTYTNKYQSFFFEYKKNGPLYNSLGNPFLRTNYEGFIAGERFTLFKRKLSIDLNYQNFSNDLNQSLPVKVYTQAYRSNIFINPGGKWPMVFLNYVSQFRKGNTVRESIQPINDIVSNYLLGFNMNRNFWGTDHHFRLTMNVNNRKDVNRPQNQFTSYNGSVGLTERFSKRYALNADFGKMVLNGVDGKKLSDIATYNLSFEWNAKPEILLTSLAVGNNQTFTTEYSPASHRASAIARLNYRFYKGMSVDLEGGYQPFRNEVNSAENYDESYVYLRYTCDIGALFY
jgi:hypothetical protein